MTEEHINDAAKALYPWRHFGAFLAAILQTGSELDAKTRHYLELGYKSRGIRVEV